MTQDKQATNPLRLVAVVADEDARRLVDKLIQRGIDRGCLAPFEYRIQRDPMRDSAVVRAPERALGPLLPNPGLRVLLLWDHDGSGREADVPRAVEADVTSKLASLGMSESDVLAAAFEPELEACLAPAWDRVIEVLSARRKRAIPTNAAIGSQLDVSLRNRARNEVLAERPKELFDAVLRCLGLRHSPILFDTLGAELSIPALKVGGTLQRVSDALTRWFPGPGIPAGTASPGAETT